MIAATDLIAADRIKDRILHAAGDTVERIVLHGSRVTGRARPGSDYDVLVVLDDPVDIQVFGVEEFEECRPIPATIAYPADQFGALLYARR